MQRKIIALGLIVMALTGCATSTMLVNYTQERFKPKDKYFVIAVFPESQPLKATRPYYVISKVSVEGFASDGVNPENLANKAKVIARAKGADAIINAKTDAYQTYADELLRFTGELIVYTPS